MGGGDGGGGGAAGEELLEGHSDLLAHGFVGRANGKFWQTTFPLGFGSETDRSDRSVHILYLDSSNTSDIDSPD